VAEGRTIDQIVAAKATAPYDEKFGKGFVNADKFSEMIAGSLGARK